MHRRPGPSARVRRRRTLAGTILLALLLTTVISVVNRGNGGGAAASDPGADVRGASNAAPRGAGPGAGPGAPTEASSSDLSNAPALLADVALLGPRTAKTVPSRTRSAVVVRGDGPTSTRATIELYVLSGGAWKRTGSWRGHLGAKGWTDDHHEGDLRTPAGTYTLSDAGGRLADPGTQLPYHRSSRFLPTGSGVFGDSLEGSFDYVIAIDFNRRTGVSPLDKTQPLGEERGGGIWLHVDHDGPTHGCVSVPREGMTALLRALRPTDNPVVIMGHQARLTT